ncbi:hypothetical protein BGZ60DRAFT_392846 [Tricladium varicosporioides]|nr:hypothetical protein BGZ60DRAFT_392846 [Hymenoscyphus varicosporioides]
MSFSNATLATSTPKRKRGLPVPPTPPYSSPTAKPHLNTNITLSKEDDEAGASSPRTKVAYNFQGLQIRDGGISKLDLCQSQGSKMGNDRGGSDIDNEAMTRKRIKVLEIPETPDARITRPKNIPEPKEMSFVINIPTKPDTPIKDRKIDLHTELDPMVFKSGSPLGKLKVGGLQRAYPSINRLSDSKSRGRKRTSTPPLANPSSSFPIIGSDEARQIVDPERAALTWHDDEITGHDPSDPEDDGEGINGIGFKPTAAEAYARTQKRKKQMAEYRSREAQEERAKRSERRRASDKKAETERQSKVRFLEAEAMGVVAITTD